MDNNDKRGRVVAMVTGIGSISLGILYLVLITILDSRGPMLPPPPEALGVEGALFYAPFSVVQLLFLMQSV